MSDFPFSPYSPNFCWHASGFPFKLGVINRFTDSFPGSSVGKESPACNAGDSGSTPRSGRSPEKEMATYSSIPAWRIPWTEEPGRLQSMGLQDSDTTWETKPPLPNRFTNLNGWWFHGHEMIWCFHIHVKTYPAIYFKCDIYFVNYTSVKLLKCLSCINLWNYGKNERPASLKHVKNCL